MFSNYRENTLCWRSGWEREYTKSRDVVLRAYVVSMPSMHSCCWDPETCDPSGACTGRIYVGIEENENYIFGFRISFRILYYLFFSLVRNRTAFADAIFICLSVWTRWVACHETTAWERILYIGNYGRRWRGHESLIRVLRHLWWCLIGTEIFFLVML